MTIEQATSSAQMVVAWREKECVDRAGTRPGYNGVRLNLSLSVYRFNSSGLGGVGQQESGKEPRFANGATVLRTRRNSSCTLPLETIAGNVGTTTAIFWLPFASTNWKGEPPRGLI